MTPAPVFTPEQIKADGQNRVVRGVGQTGLASSAIVVALWVAHQCGWHGEMPPEVVLASATLLTGGAAVITNLGRLHGRG